MRLRLPGLLPLSQFTMFAILLVMNLHLISLSGFCNLFTAATINILKVSTAPFHPHAGGCPTHLSGFISKKAAPNATGAAHGCWLANGNMNRSVVMLYSIYFYI